MIGREIWTVTAALSSVLLVCTITARSPRSAAQTGCPAQLDFGARTGVRCVPDNSAALRTADPNATDHRIRTTANSMLATASFTQVPGQAKQGQDAAGPVSKPHEWQFDDFRIVPVRVHLLRDSETASAITRLTEKDIKRIFTKANGIWHAAGIHLWVESIVSEKPASTAGFEHAPSLPTNALLPLRPEATRSPGMFHVYYIGEMAPNGIFMRRDGIFVKESARLRPVKGGIDEPLPRVTAHELGHGMGLPHRQDTLNLLASGTTGTSLNDAEIEIVRTTVGKLDWVLTPEQFLKLAEKEEAEKKIDPARSRYFSLREIPGNSPLKKRAELHVSFE